MPLTSIHLKVLLPFHIFTERPDVARIVADTQAGSFGLLPHRLDCVAALGPGILTYQTQSDDETHVAIDEGVLVKIGSDVFVSVRKAVGGTDLGQLRDTVKREFAAIDEHERDARAVMAKLEAGLLHRLASFQHE